MNLVKNASKAGWFVFTSNSLATFAAVGSSDSMVSVFVDTADGLQPAVLTFSGLPDEHYLLLVVLYFFVHLCEILD